MVYFIHDLILISNLEFELPFINIIFGKLRFEERSECLRALSFDSLVFWADLVKGKGKGRG